jgi:hypothetical protein
MPTSVKTPSNKTSASKSVKIATQARKHEVRTKAPTFRALVREIKEQHGVIVATVPKPAPPKRTMTPERALEIARRAGIITKSGKLSSLYK